MNGWLLAASVLCIVGGVGHAWLGETRLLRPYLTTGVVTWKDARQSADTLRAAWHVWALAYLAAAGLLLFHALAGVPDGARPALWALAAMFAAAFLLVGIITRGKNAAVLVQVAIATLIVAGLIWRA